MASLSKNFNNKKGIEKHCFYVPNELALHFEKPSEIIFLKIHKAQRRKANFVFFCRK
jgi:hypothetical protein